ncbi:MAG TPA: hypothetical protein VFF60_04775 [Candidatus Binatus sp.]|nr:hypothetical protein [Candidatus Binatus sp.]
MKIPSAHDLLGQVLRAASQGDGITQDDLRKRLIFEFDMYEGSAAAPSLEQILRFSRRALRVQRRLLEAKLVRESEGALHTTALGNAFLRDGCERIDEPSLARLAHMLPAQETLPLVQPQPVPPQPEEAEAESEFDVETLMAGVGLKYLRHREDLYTVAFDAELRTWKVQLWFANGWLRARAFVMRAPKSGLIRAQLLQAALRVSAISIPHFCIDDEDGLYLGLDERLENLNPDVLRSLIFALLGVAQNEYPRLFRMVTREDVLTSLEAAYKRSA